MIHPGVRIKLVLFGCALAALLAIPSAASAGKNGQCPAVAEKPDAVPHVDYDDVETITYCYGPITISPGQNIIKLRPATDPGGQELWPQVPGYITTTSMPIIGSTPY